MPLSRGTEVRSVWLWMFCHYFFTRKVLLMLLVTPPSSIIAPPHQMTCSLTRIQVEFFAGLRRMHDFRPTYTHVHGGFH